MKTKTIYYNDEYNDDFSKIKINTILTPSSYVYINNNFIFKILSFILYELIARPLVFLFIKIFYLQKFENKKVLKQFKKEGYFLYANHSNTLGDAFIPSLISFPKKNYIICNPDAISIKGLKTIVKMLGALPVPSTIKGNKNFNDAINNLINKNKVITIYPEAHLWPYFTSIRPFKSVSFTYPYNYNKPCFSFTNVYVKRKFKLIKRPKIITYIDGPFYADKSLNKKDSINKLKDEIYNSMLKNNSKHEKYEYKYIYIKKQD